ncbi:hypothetical protein BDP27DRAFT_1407960 [Rhodocollybia butyracea]|uniref:Uncharacterized protein n=1 Tax=Rhodocollybia butyracea TaxID=206335 RepID=A0A9P5PB25_9AGAR|nr:hypothetical protein BDP27DRAFT_1408071 [Rhodocollybia butyracea]KAF9058870.1 hypothetical protein BDP27DRAFT_1407960 [Rhodocollybia butyracea]
MIRMPVFITTYSLVFILLQLGVSALPLNQTQLHKHTLPPPRLTVAPGAAIRIDTGRVLLGYRSVSPEKAAEYNNFGELTSIPASGAMLGNGAYLSPQWGMYPSWIEEDYWECVVTGSAQALETAPKLFVVVADTGGTNGNPSELASYIHEHNYDPARTILFSEYQYKDVKKNYQMLIPPAYLVPSPRFIGVQGGLNSLQTRVACAPRGCMPSGPSAAWHSWGISQWPGDSVHVRAEETQKQQPECSAALPASVSHETPSSKKEIGKR